MYHMSNKSIRIFRSIFLFLCFILILLMTISYFLVSAALVPSFMQRLKAFEAITEESYSQQVKTSDIQINRKLSIEATRKWLESAEMIKLEQQSLDGYRLVAAQFPASEMSHRWVILLHGYTGWKEEMYPFARWYHDQGYHVLAPDLRCQGESDGDFIGMGWTDREDVLLWIRRIIEQDPNAQIVLHGQSMGGSCALIVSGMENLPANVAAVVSDCAYTDAYSMFRKNIRDWGHLPSFPILDAANLTLQVRGGYDLQDASAEEAVASGAVPVLLIHGDRDEMVPVSMAHELYHAAGGEKEILIIHGAGHAQAQDKDPELYFTTVSAFLRKYISE